jgi:hypothetical protein
LRRLLQLQLWLLRLSNLLLLPLLSRLLLLLLYLLRMRLLRGAW